MDGKKKWFLIIASGVVAWWFLGRKKAPVVDSPAVSGDVTVKPPGDFVSDTRQPDPSSGTAVQLPKQNRILRMAPTVLAVRPEPLLMKAADTQTMLQTAFHKLTLGTTGSLSASIGSSNESRPTSFTTNNSATSPDAIAVAGSRAIQSARMTLGGLRL